MNSSEIPPAGLHDSSNIAILNNKEPDHAMTQIKEPTTPSLKKNATFDAAPFPQTPERTPHQLMPEGTPLLSPTNMGSGTTPSKRRSTDFYSLLKSPDVNRNDVDLKRRSVELNKIVNKSPERLNNYVFHDTLLKSPKRQPGSSPFRVHKKNDNEIKEISENLKTRLNYANVKIQHGWSAKSISELEKNLEEEKSRKMLTPQDRKLQDNFWKMKTDQLPTYIQPPLNAEHRTTAPTSPSSHASPARSRASKLKLDELASKQGSAESALYKALSPERPKLTIDSRSMLPPTSHQRSASDSKLEQEAIMSLISLSSPVKYSGSQSPSPPRPAGLQKPPALSFDRRRNAGNEDTDEETELEDEDHGKTHIFKSPQRNGLKGLGLTSKSAADDDDRTASDYSD
ncbi:hypothetical protein KL942_004178 [Ogataea angusta]|uniref:Uncharacterized protein n=1 Tax=Pichia angusta TaxID=870730 RepID=A0ABQ7RT57_PICAN|nr:hypothetical protein KL942_004178 [Ogataea angusta]KAG7847216.1 hypothetical protein KL940_003962 [Ogataea angusta]